MPFKRTVGLLFIAAAIHLPLAARTISEALPNWVTKLIAIQPPKSGTVVEEATYRGHRVFQVMPLDRAPDTGNEHVLYSEHGRIICEYGGVAGHVTVGSCAIEQLEFIRSLFPKQKQEAP